MVKRFMAPGPWITRDLKECVLASDYDALAAENAALRKDAERYREWRRAFRDGECGLYNALCDADSEAEHDAAIDAHLAREEKP